MLIMCWVDGDWNVSFFTVLVCCVLQDRMKLLREQWNGLDARAKAPYEARAAHDANRYRREVRYYWPVFILLTFGFLKD